MIRSNLKKLVLSALMAALTCITTMVIPIPTPSGGYAHPGDGFVLLSGAILGPIYGGLAAGIGSLLADLFLGYSEFMIATFFIKGLSAVVAALIYKYIHKGATIIAGIAGGAVVTLGYLLFEIILFGPGVAISGIPMNLVQNVLGILISVFILPILRKIPQIKEIINEK